MLHWVQSHFQQGQFFFPTSNTSGNQFYIRSTHPRLKQLDVGRNRAWETALRSGVRLVGLHHRAHYAPARVPPQQLSLSVCSKASLYRPQPLKAHSAVISLNDTESDLIPQRHDRTVISLSRAFQRMRTSLCGTEYMNIIAGRCGNASWRLLLRNVMVWNHNNVVPLQLLIET